MEIKTLNQIDFLSLSNKIKDSLSELNYFDNFLLSNSLGERSISHKFAERLSNKFSGYDVDCEYDKSCLDKNISKSIYLFKDEAQNYYNNLKKSEKLIKYFDSETDELWEKLVIPDIVVHKRGSDQNLIVFEIKKLSKKTKLSEEFDYFKLKKYTSKTIYKGLRYKFGIYIEFNDNNNIDGSIRKHNVKCFKNGDFYNFIMKID